MRGIWAFIQAIHAAARSTARAVAQQNRDEKRAARMIVPRVDNRRVVRAGIDILQLRIMQGETLEGIERDTQAKREKMKRG
jgi:hypothetical protein